MLKRSAGIYLGGFVFGVGSSALIITIYPSFYYAFLNFLTRKVEAQSAVVGNFTLMIIANNLVAAGIASYGGTLLSKVFNLINGATARNKVLLFALPAGILFVNGEVLGLLAVLYVENISAFIAGVTPHGLLEIPAIILSGSIGMEISEESQKGLGDFQPMLNQIAAGKLPRFAIAAALLIIGGILEGRAL